MEVADQWRRQWAGTAEYGKVTEGGVTRRVARAMEVLHASGPGARVRVMRAAYHSSAVPGIPAESFMLHSSRRVISSGFNFLEPPSLPTRPLEISSTPLEQTQDCNGESENYKVTEPDDFEISEPSKWRSSTKGSSIRMPSEESSSTDNASIIDLDARYGKNLHRKYSYDSENSDLQYRSRSNSRTSLLLDSPTTLSTLKYKSFLNSSNEWNARRKSYSFEDTSPLNETILHNNETLAMESSTDSGICKSTEIVNDHVDDNSHTKCFVKIDQNTNHKEGTFSDWLTKNRHSSQFKGTKFKTYRDHDIVVEDPKENNISLQSSGKVSITLPVTVEVNHDNFTTGQSNEDFDKRIKRVGFCKTEVHFTAESGKVNIIATDEKPPPSTDFRKRRSAFVPMHDITEKPITLFGEKSDFPSTNGVMPSLNQISCDFSDPDENTAATKSILKNKIPKPKPYLLGENMEFGNSDVVSTNTTNKSVLTAISLVNRNIESGKRYNSETQSIFSREAERNVINHNIFRTINAGPTKNDSLKHEKRIVDIKIEKAKDDIYDSVENKFTSLKDSPTQMRSKSRKLRDSDLTYFGIDSGRKVQDDRVTPRETKISYDNILEDIFQSVKLIQKVSNSVSNSVCNSEPESDDTPEYQNIPLNLSYAPVPTPRLRSKYDNMPNEIAAVRAALKPITENKSEETKKLKEDNVKSFTRRTKDRRQEAVKESRSLSEPPKNLKSLERPRQPKGQKSSINKYQASNNSRSENSKQFSLDDRILEDDTPIYANLNDTEKLIPLIEKPIGMSAIPLEKEKQRSNMIKNKIDATTDVSRVSHSYKINEDRSGYGTDSAFRKKSPSRDTLSSTLKRETKSKRSDRHSKAQHCEDISKSNNEELNVIKYTKSRNNKHKNERTNTNEQNNISLAKTVTKTASDEMKHANQDNRLVYKQTSSPRKRNLSKDKISAKSEKVKVESSLKPDSDSTQQYTIQKLKNNERENEHHHRASKHREYVINYDDKNGTVSSICKIKPNLGIPRHKKISKEMLKESNRNDNQLKSKRVDKIAMRK